MRNRLLRKSLLEKTKVEASGPGRRFPWLNTWMPGTSNRSARELIPAGGKSGSSFPGGTGIASVVPAVFPEVSVPTYSVLPSKDHWTGQPYVQIVRTSLLVVEKALT